MSTAPSIASRALRFLPLAILLVGIGVHGALVVTLDDDPQRGSAFAMFSTIDFGSTRRVVSVAPGVTPISLEVPEDLGPMEHRLGERPTLARAEVLGARLLDRTWTVTGDNAVEGGPTTFSRVQVTVIGLDADGRSVTRQVLITADVSEDGPP